MPFMQIVVNPEPEPEASSKTSKRAAEAQMQTESDRKQGKGRELEAKQPGAPASEHPPLKPFCIKALCAGKAHRAEPPLSRTTLARLHMLPWILPE